MTGLRSVALRPNGRASSRCATYVRRVGRREAEATGGTATKPVGLVHFGLARNGAETVHLERRYGALGRETIRRRAVEDALALLEQAVR